jgi:hypothetical protein
VSLGAPRQPSVLVGDLPRQAILAAGQEFIADSIPLLQPSRDTLRMLRSARFDPNLVWNRETIAERITCTHSGQSIQLQEKAWLEITVHVRMYTRHFPTMGTPPDGLSSAFGASQVTLAAQGRTYGTTHGPCVLSERYAQALLDRIAARLPPVRRMAAAQ